jgi:hypothetical protein
MGSVGVFIMQSRSLFVAVPWYYYAVILNYGPSVSRLSRTCGPLDVSPTYGPPHPVAGISLPFFFKEENAFQKLISWQLYSSNRIRYRIILIAIYPHYSACVWCRNGIDIERLTFAIIAWRNRKIFAEPYTKPSLVFSYFISNIPQAEVYFPSGKCENIQSDYSADTFPRTSGSVWMVQLSLARWKLLFKSAEETNLNNIFLRRCLPNKPEPGVRQDLVGSSFCEMGGW